MSAQIPLCRPLSTSPPRFELICVVVPLRPLTGAATLLDNTTVLYWARSCPMFNWVVGHAMRKHPFYSGARYQIRFPLLASRSSVIALSSADSSNRSRGGRSASKSWKARCPFLRDKESTSGPVPRVPQVAAPQGVLLLLHHEAATV